LASVPNGRGHVEQFRHFALPLPEQRLRREHDYGLGADEGHQFRRHRQLHGLAQPDLVGQHEPRAARVLQVRVESQFHEILLVLPETGLLPVHRRFDEDGRGHGGYGLRHRLFRPIFHRRDDLAAAEPLDVFDDEIGQRHGRMVRPQGVELLLDPGHGFRRRVFPEQLVVQRPGRLGLVHAAQERRLGAVGQRDDPRFAMDEPEVSIGQDLDLEFPATEELIQASETVLGRRAAGVGQFFGPRGAPLLPQGVGRRACRGHVLRLQAGVADHADRRLDRFQRFAGRLQDRAAEVARNAVVGPRAAKPLGEEGAVQPLAAGREAADGGGVCGHGCIVLVSTLDNNAEA
jgi:hypothetical protein